MNKNTGLTLIAIVALALIVFFSELLYVIFTGSKVPIPDIPRQKLVQGQGKELSYVIMGDSTSISQGSEYSEGYAVASHRHLATSRRVTMINTGVSGATVKSVLDEQLADAISYSPDLVLLAVGANDATKFSPSSSIKNDLQEIIDGLKQSNPAVKIVVTRSPAMDSVSRFPFISKWVMNVRTRQVNEAFAEIIRKNDLTLAPIAGKTRQAFIDDPTLTASDKFHPNARGYELWKPVINSSLDQALAG